MSAHWPDLTFAGPLDVTVAEDGSIKLFLPNGDTLCLTAKAAALSSARLNHAVKRATRQRQRACKRPLLGTGEVIAVDFVNQIRIA